MSSTTSLPLPAPTVRHGRARATFAGLTSRVLIIVAALLLARSLGFLLANDTPAPLRNLLWGLFHVVLMAAPILLAVVAAGNLAPPRGPVRWLALTAAISLAPGVGVLLRLLCRELGGAGPRWSQFAGFAGQTWPRYALFAGLLTLGLEVYRRQRAAGDTMRQIALDRAALERELADVRLQVLQAQIEPHFLFNTLATVRRLNDTDPTRARTMLDSLIRFLEMALPTLRDERVTLGREFELAEAYLQVQQIRMPRRLAFAFDVAAELRELTLPPLMLLTLVENAVKHGVQPSLHGGALRIAARLEAGTLVLTVADSGVGFAPGSGSGMGLANIRARLAAEFGAAATLAIENNDVGGVTATLRLPAL